MILLSGMFCGDNHSFDYTPTNVPNIKSIKIGNGVFDEIFATRSTSIPLTEKSKEWTFDTILYALFKDNLFAGNVEFTSDSVSAMRIKRRKKGTYTWDTFFEIAISTNEDFNFERLDRYARANTKYEYSLIPVINGVEGNLNINEIETKFDGFYFIEKDVIYRALLNTELHTERNHNGKTVTTLDRKYPFHITNGNSNYTSGQLQATFIDKLLDNSYDVQNGWKYREQVNDFLTNGKPKILKDDEGRMWMVGIVDSIPENAQGHYQHIISNISFVEIGDSESVEDLYDNNFIDLDSRLMR